MIKFTTNLISVRLKHTYVIHRQSVWNDEQEKKRRKFCWLISRKQLGGSYSNLEYGFPFIEANSTVNWCHLEKTWRSYWYVKIVTLLFLSICSLYLYSPRFLGLHDTLTCVLRCLNWSHSNKTYIFSRLLI